MTDVRAAGVYHFRAEPPCSFSRNLLTPWRARGVKGTRSFAQSH